MSIVSAKDSTDVQYIRVELDLKGYCFNVVPSHGPKSYIDTSNIYTDAHGLIIDVMDEKDVLTAKKLLLDRARRDAEMIVDAGKRLLKNIKLMQGDCK